MSSIPSFGTQLIGRTEKALSAILARELRGTPLDERRWIALTLASAGDGEGAADGAQLERRLAGALRTDAADARAHLRALASEGLVDDSGARVTVTEAGRRLQDGIRAGIGRITDRLWGDLPADDLSAAARVLATVLARADAELSGAGAGQSRSSAPGAPAPSGAAIRASERRSSRR